jgi:hypothetical protein
MVFFDVGFAENINRLMSFIKIELNPRGGWEHVSHVGKNILGIININIISLIEIFYCPDIESQH